MQTPFVVCVSAVVFSCLSLAMGQVAPGHPSFVPQDCGQYDCINLQNLNVSLNVPVYSKSGAFPLNFGLSGADSYFYNNAGAMTSGILTVPLADSVNGVLGYYSLQAVYTATASVTCPSGDGTGAATKYSGWELINVAGTVHPLPVSHEARQRRPDDLRVL